MVTSELRRQLRLGKKIFETDVKKYLYFQVHKGGEDPRRYPAYRIIASLAWGKCPLEEFDLLWNPGESCLDPEYISGSMSMMSDILGGRTKESCYNELMERISPYINISDPRDRIILIGYGNHSADDMLLRDFFSGFPGGSTWFKKLFYPMSIDLKGAASVFMQDYVDDIPGNSFVWAASMASIQVDPLKMHLPYYRIKAIRLMHESRFSPRSGFKENMFILNKLRKKSARLENLKDYNI